MAKRVWFFFGLLLSLTTDRALAVEPRNLSLLKHEIAEYVDSGRYQQEIAAAAQPVLEYLEQRVKVASPATNDRRLAIVFDLDETMLSNLPHMRRLDFGYVPAEWDAWVAQGEAPVIEPVREIYRAAHRLGVAVLYLSGRHESDRPGTEKNLRLVHVDEYAALVLRPNNVHSSNAVFKAAARAQFEKEGWTIVANVGDQDSDLEGGHAERGFKLPDPFYLSPE